MNYKKVKLIAVFYLAFALFAIQAKSKNNSPNSQTPPTPQTPNTQTPTQTPTHSPEVPTHHIGDLYGGGIVFWVDPSGQHGLIVSMIDLSVIKPWSDKISDLVGSTNDWDGASNTNAIYGQGEKISSAAKLCKEYTNSDYGTGVFSDWYLPSIGELNHVWNSFYEVQKALSSDGNSNTTPIERTAYWSSTETSATNAMFFGFNSGSANSGSKFGSNYIRAVRAF